jgi:hypothetical protein
MKTKLNFLFAALLSGCTLVNTPPTETQKKAIQEEGQKSVHAMFEALTVNDMEKLIGLMDSCPDCMIVVGDQVIPMVPDTFRQISDGFIKQTFEIEDERYLIPNTGCFIYYWNGKNNIYLKSGDTIKYDNYFGSYVFRKVGNEWKIFYGHESYSPPVVNPVNPIAQKPE